MTYTAVALDHNQLSGNSFLTVGSLVADGVSGFLSTAIVSGLNRPGKLDDLAALAMAIFPNAPSKAHRFHIGTTGYFGVSVKINDQVSSKACSS